MKIIILLCLIMGPRALKATHRTEPKHEVDTDDTESYSIQKDTNSLYDMITTLQKQVLDQNRRLTEQNNIIRKLERTINQVNSEHSQTINEMMQIFDFQTKTYNQALATHNASNNDTPTVAKQRPFNSLISFADRPSYYKMTDIQYNRFLAFGCLSDVIHLSCSGEKLINVTSAFYGEYHYAFNNTCPVPHPTDECEEYVPSSRPSDWVALKLSCDNITTCDFQYRGSTFVNECTIDKTADFMIIYYSCIPDDIVLPIGFSAQPYQSRSVKGADHLLFDVVKINLGEHYQGHASVFICPANGVYLISVNILAYTSYPIEAWIHVESTRIASALGDLILNAQNQGAMTTIVECSAGERIWLKSATNGYLYYYDFSVFTGYLLHLYN